MDDLDRYHAEQMKDPECAAEYERLEPVYDIISAITMARAEQNLTQRELAERCGMRQSAFARLESGNANPTLKTLQQVAKGLGKKLRISFVCAPYRRATSAAVRPAGSALASRCVFFAATAANRVC